jgi:ParB family chromosome partitioning protein
MRTTKSRPPTSRHAGTPHANAYDAIHDKPPVIRTRLKANVGCFVTSLHRWRTGDRRAASTATSRLQRRKARGSAPDGAGQAMAAVIVNKPKPLSQKLVEELAVQRRDILAINLASNPAIALDYHDLRDR